MGVKYIEPAIGKKAFTCPHCGAISLMHFYCINYIDKNVIEFHGENMMEIVGCKWRPVRTVQNI